MIELRHLAKHYAEHVVLKDVQLTIEMGEKLLLSGSSGAGKSTLLKIIAALEMPSKGEVIIDGKSLVRMRRAALPFFRRHFGLIFQDPKLLFDRSALDNVLFPLQIAGVPMLEAKRRAEGALDKVGLLKYAKALPVTLSGGEQQRLAIARAVVHRPSVLMADEPTSHLDQATAREIMALFDNFHQVGVTQIIVTHDPLLIDHANSANTRHVILKDGVIV